MPINSADDLSRQTVIEYGTLHGSASMEFFKNSQIDVYRKIWEFMTSRPYVIVNSTLEGVEFVRESEGRYAFLLEGALSDYHNTRYPCDTITIGKPSFQCSITYRITRQGCTIFLPLRETIEESAKRRHLWQYWACRECNADSWIGSQGCKQIGLQGRVRGRYRYENPN